MKTLTEEFNEITVNKGEKFAIKLAAGGLFGTDWTRAKVVPDYPSKPGAGYAQEISYSEKSDFPDEPYISDSSSTLRYVFLAVESGDVRITAKQKSGVHSATTTFKVHVK